MHSIALCAAHKREKLSIFTCSIKLLPDHWSARISSFSTHQTGQTGRRCASQSAEPRSCMLRNRKTRPHVYPVGLVWSATGYMGLQRRHTCGNASWQPDVWQFRLRCFSSCPHRAPLLCLPLSPRSHVTAARDYTGLIQAPGLVTAVTALSSASSTLSSSFYRTYSIHVGHHQTTVTHSLLR